jgi:hypothetical protein
MHACCTIQPWCSPALLLLVATLCFVSVSESAKLLVVPLASSSHIAAFTALTTALERYGGHEIHMVCLVRHLTPTSATATAKMHPLLLRS